MNDNDIEEVLTEEQQTLRALCRFGNNFGNSIVKQTCETITAARSQGAPMAIVDTCVLALATTAAVVMQGGCTDTSEEEFAAIMHKTMDLALEATRAQRTQAVADAKKAMVETKLREHREQVRPVVH